MNGRYGILAEAEGGAGTMVEALTRRWEMAWMLSENTFSTCNSSLFLKYELSLMLRCSIEFPREFSASTTLSKFTLLTLW